MLNSKKVWVNGTFDVLHSGHIKLFEYGKFLAGPSGQLIVGTDTDERIRELKGPTRPINNLDDRIYFLRAIRYVDKVCVFSRDSELEALIHHYSPDILLIGSDYRGKNIIGSQFAQEIKYFDRYGDLSTSKIIGG